MSTGRTMEAEPEFARGPDAGAAYRAAFTDWLACACAGASEAARAVRAGGADLVAGSTGR